MGPGVMAARRAASGPGRRAWRRLLLGWAVMLVAVMAGLAEFNELPGPLRTLAVTAAASVFGLIPVSAAVTVSWLAIRGGEGPTAAYDEAWRRSRGLRVITRVGWCFGVLFILVATGVLVAVVPDQVNSAAYLAGAGQPALFSPSAHVSQCGQGELIVTSGTLGSAGAPAAWPGAVPIGRPFSVRSPVWNAPCEADITTGVGQAARLLIVGVFADAFAVFMMMMSIGMFRRRRLRAAAADRPTAVIL
jgi:hypothetical protein